MQDLCPLCMKNGVKKKVKAIQINLQEAVWACESEECIWPFGCEDFKFISRKVGQIWSFNWDTNNTVVPKFKECIPFSTELSLYTPPVTPNGEAVKESATADYPHSAITCNKSVTTVNKIDTRACIGNDDAVLKDSKGDNICTLTTVRDNNLTQCIETNIFDADFHKTLIDSNNVIKTGKTSLNIRDKFKTNNEDRSMSNTLGKPMNVGEEKNICCNNDNVVILKNCNKELSEKDNAFTANNVTNTTTNLVDNDVTNTNNELLVKKVSVCNNSSVVSSAKTNSISKTNNLKTVPEIVSIEKTNFDITLEKQHTFHIKLNKNANVAQQTTASTEQSNSDASSELKFQPEVNSSPEISQFDNCKLTECVDESQLHGSTSLMQNISNDVETNQTTTVDSDKSTIKVTTVKINGLPPVTLSFQTPAIASSNVNTKCTLTENSQTRSEMFEEDSVVSTHSNNDKFVKQSVKRGMNVGKQYKKFNFNTLRKKVKHTPNDSNENESNSVSSPNNISTCCNVTNMPDISCLTAASNVTVDSNLDNCNQHLSNKLPIASECTASVESNIHANVSDTSISVPTTFNTSSVLETNVDLDFMLDDLLGDTCKNDSQNLDDDWIEFLLN